MDSLASLEFREPLALALALLAAPAFLLARRDPGRVAFSSFRLLPRRGGGWRVRWAWLPDAMVAAALVALVVALAGPRIGERLSRIQREGIAIMMSGLVMLSFCLEKLCPLQIASHLGFALC